MKLQAHLRRSSAVLLAALFVSGAAWGPPAFAQATTVTTNETIPYASTLTNPCNGDIITFSGQLHTTNHVTTDAAGGFHVRSHVNYQNVSGTGAPSGATYRVVTATNESLNTSTESQSEMTVVQTVNLIAQGQLPKSMLRTVFHITINANGTTTTVVDESRVECLGPPIR